MLDGVTHARLGGELSGGAMMQEKKHLDAEQSEQDTSPMTSPNCAKPRDRAEVASTNVDSLFTGVAESVEGPP